MTYPLNIGSIANKLGGLTAGNSAVMNYPGIFVSSAGSYYMVSLPPAPGGPQPVSVRMLKAISDPSTVGTTNGWNAIGTDQSLGTGNTIELLGACTDSSNNIHVAIVSQNTSTQDNTLWHAVYSMTSDSWTLAPESVDANTSTRPQIGDINGNTQMQLPILVRSNGDVVIFYTISSASNSAPIHVVYARKVSGTWTTQVQVGHQTTNVDEYLLGMVAGASDLFHLFWLEDNTASNTAAPRIGPIRHRSLNSSNTLGTSTATTNNASIQGNSTTGIGAEPFPTNSCISFTYQGTITIACFAPNSAQTNLNVAYFTDAQNPTMTEATSVLGTLAFSSSTFVLMAGAAAYLGNLWVITVETNNNGTTAGYGLYQSTTIAVPSAFGVGSQLITAANMAGQGDWTPIQAPFIDSSIGEFVVPLMYVGASPNVNVPFYNEFNLKSVVPPFVSKFQYLQPLNMRD